MKDATGVHQMCHLKRLNQPGDSMMMIKNVQPNTAAARRRRIEQAAKNTFLAQI